MVEIHVDTLAGFEQPHLHVEFHQKVIEPWVGVESEHIEFCNTDGSLTENGGLTPPIYTGNQTLKFKPKKMQMEVY